MNTLNKILQFIKKNNYFFSLLALISTFLLFINWQFSDIGFLGLHSIDEYVFHSSIRHMIDSFLLGNFSGIFGFGFYQYGFIYFLLNAIAATPGILTDNYTWAIIAPRVVTSLFAVGSLIYIYKFTRLYAAEITATLTTAIFVTMPAFWYNATWFHPDWPMTFFLLAFVYYLAKDNWNFGKYFKLAVIAYGLALAFKYQAITAVPLLGLYIFYDNFQNPLATKWWLPTKRFLIALFQISLIFLICNPYILHPMGWLAFSTAFLANMTSNATNHGSGEIVSLVTKINSAVADYYLNIIFAFILLLGTIWLTGQFFKSRQRSIFFVIAVNFLINFAYLLFFVNKAWQTYYLPVVIVGLLSLLFFVQKNHLPRPYFILSLIIIIQLIVYSSSYTTILSQSRDAKAQDYNTYTEAQNKALDEFIIHNLEKLVNSSSDVLITAYTPFSFDKLNLNFDQVNLIFSALNRSNIDSTAYLAGQKNYWGDIKSDAELKETFKPANIIILRKNIPFMNQGDFKAYKEAFQIVKELYNGSLGYTVLAENEFVVIFNKLK